jgi:hypothetical protein
MRELASKPQKVAFFDENGGMAKMSDSVILAGGSRRVAD